MIAFCLNVECVILKQEKSRIFCRTDAFGQTAVAMYQDRTLKIAITYRELQQRSRLQHYHALLNPGVL